MAEGEMIFRNFHEKKEGKNPSVTAWKTQISKASGLSIYLFLLSSPHRFCLRRDKILGEQQIPRAFAVAIPVGPKTGVGAQEGR